MHKHKCTHIKITIEKNILVELNIYENRMYSSHSFQWLLLRLCSQFDFESIISTFQFYVFFPRSLLLFCYFDTQMILFLLKTSDQCIKNIIVLETNLYVKSFFFRRSTLLLLRNSVSRKHSTRTRQAAH